MANDMQPREQSELQRERQEMRGSTAYQEFMKDLRQRAAMGEHDAEAAAVAVLCRLEQRLLAEEASDTEEAESLKAQLPFSLSGLLQRCERHMGEAPQRFSRKEFISLIAQDLDCDEAEAELAALAVFEAVRKRLSDDEAMDVERQLPEDLKTLWYPPA